MPNSDSVRRKNDPWLGTAFLGVAVLILVLSGSIHTIGLGDNFDPGPKAFPIGLSLLILIGGLVEFLPSRKKRVTDHPPEGEGKTKTVLYLLGAFLIYVLVMPWLGFALSTLIMAPGMMILLGNTWKHSLVVTLFLITVIYLLFVILFKVPLPSGVLGLPF